MGSKEEDSKSFAGQFAAQRFHSWNYNYYGIGIHKDERVQMSNGKIKIKFSSISCWIEVVLKIWDEGPSAKMSQAGTSNEQWKTYRNTIIKL